MDSKTIYGVFTSPNETDRNFEPANMVDGLFEMSRAVRDVAAAVRDLAMAFRRPGERYYDSSVVGAIDQLASTLGSAIRGER